MNDSNVILNRKQVLKLKRLNDFLIKNNMKIYGECLVYFYSNSVSLNLELGYSNSTVEQYESTTTVKGSWSISGDKVKEMK